VDRGRPTSRVGPRENEELTERDKRVVEARLAEIDRGEFVSLPELQRELEERRRKVS
jgi:hypothetical protein